MAVQDIPVDLKTVSSIFTVYSVTGMCFVRNSYPNNHGKIFISGSFGVNPGIDGESDHWAIGCANVRCDGNKISYEELRLAQDGRNGHLTGRVGTTYCCLNSMCALFGSKCIAVAAWTLPTDEQNMPQQQDEALYILLYEVSERSNILTLRQTLIVRPSKKVYQDLHDHVSLVQWKESDDKYSLFVAVRDARFLYRFTGGKFRPTGDDVRLFENPVPQIIDGLGYLVRYFDLPVNSEGVAGPDVPFMASLVAQDDNRIELHDRLCPSFNFAGVLNAPQPFDQEGYPVTSNWNPGQILARSLDIRADASEIAFLEDGDNLRISINHDHFQTCKNVLQGVLVTAWTFVEIVRSARDVQTEKAPLGHLVLFDGAVSRFRSYAVELLSDQYVRVEPRAALKSSDFFG